MSEPEEAAPLFATDQETRELLGMFDAPSFARRGQDVEYAVKRLAERLARERGEMLDMVRTRLRQWAAGASRPGDDSRFFDRSILPLWTQTGAPEPIWGTQPATDRRLRGIARDLVASLERFKRRWSSHLDRLDTERLNRQIELYNRNYLLEKECYFGSPRLAARHFRPMPPVDRDWLLDRFPLIEVPALIV